MRETVRNLIIGNGPLVALIPTERWFQVGNVLDLPPKMFATLRWLAPVAGDAKGAFAHQLQVTVYDHRGSYKRIDEVLGGPYRAGGVYPLLAGIAGLTGVDGYVMQADYLGDSGDQEDVDYKANMKFSSWQIIGRSL
jgi:hypothetical protein